MRTKKKIIAILLIATIISSFIPNLVSFAAEPSFTMVISGSNATTKTAKKGDIVSVDINLANGLEGQKSLAILLDYDATKLEPQADFDGADKLLLYGKNPETGEDYSLNDQIAPAGIIRGYVETDAISMAFNTPANIATNAKVATLKFKVVEGGSSDITFKGITYDLDTGAADSQTSVTSTSKVTITGNIPLEGIEVTPDKATINKGESVTLTAKKLPVDTTDTSAIGWTTSNAAVATVNNGVVTATGRGTATITATCNGKTAKVDITVNSPLTGITISDTEETVNRGKTYQLTATKVPGDTNDTNPINWSSSDDNIATVDQTGLVTAHNIGTATITAKCGTSFSESAKITVNVPLSRIELNKEEVAVDVNETYQLTATKVPGDTTDITPIEWSSSNKDVATVDETGLVTGKSFGDTIITAKCGESIKTCFVKVNVHIESIKIVNDKIDNSKNLELSKGREAELAIDFEPDVFAEPKTIEWKSTNTAVAKVENGVVTAVAPGTTTITAKTVNGKTDSITVTVPEVKASDLIINKLNTTIEKGETQQLTATVEPENTTDDTTVTWTSDNESVVTVDQTGLVTAVGVGNATITATAAGFNAYCAVEVTCALKSISFNFTEVTLEAGKQAEEKLVVKKTPTDATVDETTATIKSLNESVATISNGIITAVGPGTAIIEAELDGKIARCTVTVIVKLTGVEIENETETLELKKKQTSKLEVLYTPSNATEIPEATWTSSNEEVAKVDANGNVTALKEGTATITVTYGDTIKASRKVNVTEIHADTVVIDKVIETLNKGETESLSAIMTPADTTDDIVWTSSDETVLAVDKDGKITALKAGKATITATATNGESASMDIEIKEVALESIKVSSKDKSVKEGDTTQIEVEYNPANTTDDLTVTYTSSNESIATVDNNGKITAKKAGNVVITVAVEAVNGEGKSTIFKSQIELNVKEAMTSVGGMVQPDAAPAPSPAPAPVAGLTTSPHTGDMNIVALVVMMLVSLVGMVVVIKKK